MQHHHRAQGWWDMTSFSLHTVDRADTLAQIGTASILFQAAGSDKVCQLWDEIQCFNATNSNTTCFWALCTADWIIIDFTNPIIVQHLSSWPFFCEHRLHRRRRQHSKDWPRLQGQKYIKVNDNILTWLRTVSWIILIALTLAELKMHQE